MQQQGKAQGWSKDMVAQRNALQSQLTKLEVQSAAGQTQGASTTGTPAPAQLSGITQILAKQIPAMSEQELQQAIAHYGPNHKRTQKLEKALQALAQQTLTAIETGANANVSQASQAQQGSAQPAQATRAQATASGPSAVGEAARIAKEGNAQREQDRQRQLDASERWMRMTTVERQAITQASKGLNAPQRANVHKAAWGDLSEKVRAKLADAMGNQTAVAGKDAGNQPLALVNKAQVATESVANPSTGQTPVKQAAQPVGDEKPFAPETGTLGIPRADMPQVPTANHGGMVKHLNAQGIAHETTMVDAAALKPTQAEYSPAKVEAAKSATGDRAVIVSSDGHIIDGHHQAVAAAEEGKQVKAIVLDAPVEQALAAVKASPSANAAPASAPATEPTPAPAPKSVPQRMKEAKAAKDEAAASKRVAKPKSIPAKMREAMAARADYFTPGNIVKGYSGHDRVIAYTTRDSHGGWSVTVQAVRKQGDGWVNEANEGPRTHTTQPTARDLKAGPVERGIDVLGREDELPFSRSTLEAPQTDQEKALVLQGAPVAEVDTAIAPMGAPAIRSWATDLFEQQGGKAHNPALGDVMLDGRSVRSSLAHGRPNAHKVAAFAAVKDVLEKGAVVLSARHGRDGDSFYVSAPVKVGGAINIVTVLVKRDPNDQRMYLHSVATKEYLLNRRVSRTDTTSGVERSGSNDSGDASTLAKQRDVGKASTEEVADELHRLLTLNAGERADNASTTARFRREAADTATGADFDVASFLQIMNEGQPASAAAAAAPAMNVRPSYSSAARAEAVRAVTGTADAIRQAWANGPEVIVAFDMQDPVVPESARRADLKQRSGGARGAPEGFYYQGKVYLMASKLKTPNDAARVLFHEALGHHGLRGLFGKELDQILNQVANMREKEVDAKISEYGLRGVSKLDRRTAAEEVLAEMAQSTPQIGFVRRAVAAIRTWLRTHVPGFKSLALTDAELIRNYILPARAWVENGGAAGNLNGVASFSRDSREAPQTDLEKALVLQGAPVAVLDLKNAPSGGYAAVERWAADLFAQQGGKAISPEFGEVLLDARSAKSSVAHGGANDAKKVAFAAVKDVIERGALVYRTTAGNTDSFYSSAPVSISGKDNIVTVLVRRDHNTQRMYLHSVSLKENLLKPRVSSVDANKASERSGSTSSGEVSTLANGVQQGKVATEDVARELNRLLTLDTSSTQDGAGEPMFSRSRFMDLKDSALDQLSQTFTHEGKVSLWDKSVGTMRHLGERAPAFKPVYEAASQNIEDVSMLANDAADAAPRLIPRVESLRDMLGKDRKKPVSAADNKAVGKPLFEGTLIWGRDENGKATLVEDLQKRHANLSVHNKAAMLLKQGKIDSGVLAMWQGKPLEQFEKLIDSRFESVFLKPGIVWSDTELQSLFGANANQISLYREARAAIDRSIDMTARTDMLRVVGEKYEAMRDAVLGQPSVEAAAQLLLDTLEQDAKADPDSRDRLGEYMQQIKRRMETATDLQKAGYAPLSRFGRYTVDVVDANGERQYFGMYETARDSNLAKMQLAQEFKGATITTGTMSAQTRCSARTRLR
ncbi:hypothetical protein [Comamonas sp. 26]|uniref:LPD3 domain-containing protein n=1 Tax=Comamonas sp. 26 TaxID=2035201 RepID=UPI0013043CFF|nr:hypothetical protein [Comamonas sp. 26]